MPLTPVRTDRTFRRRLVKKPHKMQEAVAACILQLRKDPFYPGLRTHRVQGRRGIYEARIDRSNRLTFYWEDDTIVLENHCSHEIVDR